MTTIVFLAKAMCAMLFNFDFGNHLSRDTIGRGEKDDVAIFVPSRA